MTLADGAAGNGQAAPAPASYAAAGVDVVAGERAVDLMRASVAAATRPEVLDGFGGFAGLFDLSIAKEYQRPVLATSTDGVGTKVAIARALAQRRSGTSFCSLWLGDAMAAHLVC